MIVELKPHIGIGVRSRQPVHFEQYIVLVDGVPSGYIGFAKDHRVCLHRKFGPIERKEIESQVAVLKDAESLPSAQVPDVPDEYRQRLRESEEGITSDDID